MNRNYDRYQSLKNGREYKMMPFVEIPKNMSDKYIEWNPSTHRMDKLADKYYNNPFMDFLILYANPQIISQFDIEMGTIIRIPFPLEKAKNDYESGLNNLIKNKI